MDWQRMECELTVEYGDLCLKINGYYVASLNCSTGELEVHGGIGADDVPALRIIENGRIAVLLDDTEEV